MFLKLYLKRPIEKKRLVIIEFPEFYADSKKTHELIQTIKYWSKKGTYFLIVSNFEIDGQRNIEYEGKIINNGKIESIKKQVINALPFYCDDIMYEEAKEDLLEVVDNINFDDYYLNLSTINDQKKLVIIFTINYFLGLRFPVDINGFPENLVNFIRSYS